MDNTPVIPNRKIFHKYTTFSCGACGKRVFLKSQTCRFCGRRIDWFGAYRPEKGRNEPTEGQIYNLSLQVGVCPRCKTNMSDILEHGGRKYRHCYSCMFDFYFKEDLPDDRSGQGASGAPKGDPDAEV